MYVNNLIQIASSPLKAFCCKSKRNFSVRAKRGNRIRESWGGFGVCCIRTTMEGTEIQNPPKQAAFEVSGAEHGSADGKGGNLALPLKAELFGRVNGQQLIKPFLLCVL